MFRIVLFFLFAGTLSVNANQQTPQKLQVLSTIKPIHLIVIELVDDKANARVLIPENASPHSYSYKPSDITKIKKASLIFRVDEHLESMISPTLEKYSSQDKLISLADAKEIHSLSLKGGHNHNHSGEENTDLHIWTSPENSLAMADSITAHLIIKDKLNAKTYEDNLKAFKLKILKKIKSTKIELQQLKNKPYVVFNNNWRYFEQFFGLKEPIVVNKQEGQSGNIRTIVEIRKKIASHEVGCVFSDPSINPARINTIIEGQKVNTAEIFILASNTPIEKGAYFKWFNSMSTSIKNCLTPKVH